MTSMASTIAASLSELINAAAIFAAPRIYAKMPDVVAVRRGLLDGIDRYRDAIDTVHHASPNVQPLFQLADAARELQHRALQWDPGQGLSADVVEKARACLSALGIQAPAEGWDNFEGWNEP